MPEGTRTTLGLIIFSNFSFAVCFRHTHEWNFKNYLKSNLSKNPSNTDHFFSLSFLLAFSKVHQISAFDKYQANKMIFPLACEQCEWKRHDWHCLKIERDFVLWNWQLLCEQGSEKQRRIFAWIDVLSKYRSTKVRMINNKQCTLDSMHQSGWLTTSSLYTIFTWFSYITMDSSTSFSELATARLFNKTM